MEMAKREPRCIYCGKKRDGLGIREDYVIRAVRWFNRKVLHRYHNYRLVVCRDCYLNYRKARARYLKKQATYLAIGIIFAGLLIFVSSANLFAFAYGIAIILFMYLLSLVSYVPALEVGQEKKEGRLARKENRSKKA